MSRLPSPATISPPALTARQYRWFALVFLGLAVYGSLVPLRYRPMPFGRAVTAFWTIALSPLTIGSRADWATNVLLFIPLSFLFMAALCVDRPRVAGLRAALVVVPLCALVSAAIEFTQVFFPPRTPSLNDVTAESIGGVLGTMAWLARGHQITTWARALWMVRGPQRLAAWLLPGYLFALVLAHLMPFDLTIRPLEIYRKYQEGRVQWIPFATHATDPLALIQKDLENLVGFFPVGLLLTQLPGLGRRSRWSGMRVFGLGLATAGLIELLQLFVSSRFFETTDVVTGGLAVWAGWRVGTVCW